MVSPLALFSSAISGQRTAISQPRTVGFGNGTQPTLAPAPSTDRIINHNMQPFIANNGNNMNAIGQTGMYFRGSIVGARLNILA